VPVACGVLNTYDCSTLSFLAIYFMLISNDWFYFFFVMTILGAVSHGCMLFFAPDSPKWLLANGRKDEAIVAFNQIAAFNNS
jgi:hypothetical protein